MFTIGTFSKLAKTNIRTLRFYDEIGLFKPSRVEDNGYRYYSMEDFNKLVRILELRELGLSISEIKQVIDGKDLKIALQDRLKVIENEIKHSKDNLILIENIIRQIDKGEYMNKYQAKEIVLPEINVYYRHGIIENMSKLFEFVLEAGQECEKNNPNLKCRNYCYVTYEAPEYQEKNVEIEYLEAVEEFGKESKNIKFKIIPETKAISVDHKGPYSKLRDVYAFALNYIKEKGYTIADKPREVYVNGCWDCESKEDYLTRIQIPIK